METTLDVMNALKRSQLNVSDSEVLQCKMQGKLKDYNGNTVGSWEVTE